MRKQQKLAFAWSSLLVALGAMLYCSWPLGFWLNPAASRTGLASELGAVGQPYNWFFIWGDIVSGLLVVVGVVVLLRLYHLQKSGSWALLFLAIYAVCGALDAALPEQCVPSLQVCGPVLHDPMLIVHGVFDLLGSTALIGTLLAAAQYVHRHNRQWRPWIYAIGAAGTLFAVLSGILYIVGGPGYWAQRYYITLSCIWVASMPFVLRPKRLVIAKATS